MAWYSGNETLSGPKYPERLQIRYTHSRPQISDDNAFIESLFETLKCPVSRNIPRLEPGLSRV